MTKEGILPEDLTHHVTKILQQGIESDHFRLKQHIPQNGCFQSFHTARRTLKGYEAMLWLKKGLGSKGDWTINEQMNRLMALFGLKMALSQQLVNREHIQRRVLVRNII